MPTMDLFVHCYTLIDDLILGVEVMIPTRPGPRPARSDAEVITIVLERHLLKRH